MGKSSLLLEMFIWLIPCKLLFCPITINGRDIVIMFHERFLRQKVTYVVVRHEWMHYFCTRQTNRTSCSLSRTGDEWNRFRGELMQLCVRRAVKHFPHRLPPRQWGKAIEGSGWWPFPSFTRRSKPFPRTDWKSPVDQHKNVPNLAQPEQPPYAANLFLRRFFIEQAAPSEQSSL